MATSTKYQILVLGGTGAIGASLVEILGQQGSFHIVVTSRQLRMDYDGVEYRQGDAHELEWLLPILKEKRWDAIVDFMAYSTEEFYNRVDALLDATEQYVYTSSARVYANTGDNLITEDSPRLLDVCNDKEYLQTDEYALAKARQENALIQSKQRNWTIIRPYITFSNKRLQLGVMEKENWLIPALNNRPIVFSKDIAECYTTITDGLAVSKCIAALLTRSEAKGEIFHITSSESHKWEGILQWYIETIYSLKGIKPSVFLTDEWNSTFGGGFYQWKYDRLYNRQFDNSKISRFVSNDVFEPTEETIKKAMSEFVKTYTPNILDLNQSTELSRGIITSDFLPLHQTKGIKRKIRLIAYKLQIL